MTVQGELRGSLRAIDDGGAKRRLQFRDPLGDSRSGGAEALRGSGEAAGLDDGVEGVELSEASSKITNPCRERASPPTTCSMRR